MRRHRVVFAAAVVFGLVAVGLGATLAGGQGGIPAEPGRAKPTGKGSKLWVFVHPVNEQAKGKGGKPAAPSCDDVNA